MTKAEQKRFVRDLARSVTKSLLASADRWPAEWDGHELRALLARALNHEQGIVALPWRVRFDHVSGYSRKRTRAFENDCYTKGIL